MCVCVCVCVRVCVQNELCVAAGPGKDMFDSTRIIGEKQFSMGKVSGTLLIVVCSFSLLKTAPVL